MKINANASLETIANAAVHVVGPDKCGSRESLQHIAEVHHRDGRVSPRVEPLPVHIGTRGLVRLDEG